jgi:hypothetical protein
LQLVGVPDLDLVERLLAEFRAHHRGTALHTNLRMAWRTHG